MNLFLKKSFGVLVAGTLVLGSGVMAADMPAVVAGAPVITAETAKNLAIYVEGNPLRETTLQKGDTIMIPLRAVCEAMGYKVDWHAKENRIVLTLGAQYITINPQQDGYTFSKTAPMKLGQAPMNHDGYTYVPVQFIDEILGGKSVKSDGFIYLTNQDLTDQVTLNAEVKAVEDGDITVGLVGVTDERKSVVLHVTKDTKLTDAAGKTIAASDIHKGDSVLCVFDRALTKSLPPQSTAYSIQVKQSAELEEEVPDKVMYYGKIAAIENGALYMDGVNEKTQLIVRADDNTTLCDKAGKAIKWSDLKVGTFVAIEESDAITLSLPPQVTAKSITETEYVEVSSRIVAVDAKENQVTVALEGTKGETPNEQFVLNVDGATRIYNKSGERISIQDLKKGDSIDIVHSVAMTMSLPGQTYAYSIQVK